MRRWSILLAAALLPLTAGVARAQDKPTGSPPSAPDSVPGSEPGYGSGSAPSYPNTLVVDVEKVTLTAGGRAVDAAPPGVEVTVTVRLHNFGGATVRGVRAHLDETESATITDADAAYGDIARGGGADGIFGIVIDRAGCPDFLGMGGLVTYTGGTSPLKLAIPTACPGPRISLGEVAFGGGDGDGVPEPGETLRAIVELRNDGRDPATGVTAHVTISGAGASPSSADLRWADIAPGAAARSELQIRVAGDAPRQEGCPGPPGGVTILPAIGTVSPEGTVSSGQGSGQGPVSGKGSDSVSSAPGVMTDPAPAKPKSAAAPPPATAPDRAVLVEMHLDVKASGTTASVEYSNGVACALEGGLAKDLPAAAPAFAADAAKRSTGSTVLPIVIALIVSAAAVFARGLLVR